MVNPFFSLILLNLPVDSSNVCLYNIFIIYGGACMPFFDYSGGNNRTFDIDYNKYQAVSVIAAWNAAGKIKPTHFGLTDLYGNQLRIKVDGVKYTKEGYGCTTYCCLYNNGHRQLEINLTFYNRQHLWVIENKY